MLEEDGGEDDGEQRVGENQGHRVAHLKRREKFVDIITSRQL